MAPHSTNAESPAAHAPARVAGGDRWQLRDHAARWLVRLNLFRPIIKVEPMKLWFIALAIGLILCGVSWLLGVGRFTANVKFIFEPNVETPAALSLGYVQQLNYGLWNVLLCPVVLMLASLTVLVADRHRPSALPKEWRCDQINHKPMVAVLGLLILAVLGWHDVIQEFRSLNSTSLGWVQASTIASWEEGKVLCGNESPIQYVRKPPTEDGSNTPGGDLVRPSKTEITKITWQPWKPPRPWLVAAFVLVAKLWSVVWKGTVIYLAVITAFWGWGLVRYYPGRAEYARDARDARDEDAAGGVAKDGHYGLGWTQRPVMYAFTIGVLMNLFMLMRVITNLAKGSWGGADQYQQIPLLLAVPLIVLLTGLFLMVRVHTDERWPAAGHSLLSAGTLAWGGVWLASSVWVASLLLAIIDPDTQQIVMFLVRALQDPSGGGE